MAKAKKKKKVSGLVLSPAQVRELEWFCSNVAGVRLDMYSSMEVVQKFDDRICRLEKTCKLIENFIKKSSGGK